MAKNLLKVWMADNTVTTDDKTDKIFVLESTRSVDQDFVLDRMAAKNPGLHRETMAMSVNLHNEVISELVMSGYSVTTHLFRAVPQIRGLVEKNAWNPEKNSIYVSMTQGKKLREEIEDTTVQILGDRQAAIYINGTQDASTRATDLSATAGRNFTLLGKNIKVAGTDPKVGITITASDGKDTKIPEDMIVVNDPSKLIILLPSNLTDGEYTLTVTTQYSTGKGQLKTPRTASQSIYIGKAPAGGGGTSGGGDGDPDENPLG